ncbi:MAG: extracellular solute-binding protein [Alphaproteobacteria bacterium]
MADRRRRTLVFLAGIALALCAAAAPAAEVKITKSHALTLGDAPKYGPGFTHLDYVNPNAPKGGAVRLSVANDSFDSFNPFIIKGNAAAGVGFLFEPLMSSVEDDMLSDYGVIAGSVEVPADLSWVIYNLRPEARFHDGSAVTAADVVFSFRMLKEKGRPFYRFYYANVAKAEALSRHRVKFTLSGPPNRELPQIVGQIQILSKAYWEKRDFTKTTLEPPVGSGPYRIKSFEPGRYITYERVKDYWGRDLPVRRGLYNFDEIRYDYFRDQVIALEAFKARLYDFRVEGSSKDWATGYDFPARKKGLVTVKTLPNSVPVGMQGFVFNTRRAKFQNRQVRQAIALAFDFEWSNRALFYGQYTRTASFFENSELAARGLPSPEELKLLEPWRGKIPDEVFTKVYSPPGTKGDGNIRPNLRKAVRLLRKAGYKVVDNRLIEPATGRPVEIEFLLVSPAFERVVTPLIRNLRRLGIKGRVRTVDPAQYVARRREFDFDVIVFTFRQSLSPGNEQRDYWSSEAAGRAGSRNMAGIKDPAIDALVETIVGARDRESLVTASRALDRVLQWNHFVVPQWHIAADRVAWWNRFGRPPKKPEFGVGFMSWWVDPAKDAAIAKARRRK